jgi:hypothetical protein
MIPDKEKILNEYDCIYDGKVDCSPSVIESAMDEYAKALAIQFAEYCGRTRYEIGIEGGWNEHLWQRNIMSGERDISTNELFERFLEKITSHEPVPRL